MCGGGWRQEDSRGLLAREWKKKEKGNEMSASRCGRGGSILKICGRADPEEGTSGRVHHGYAQAGLGIVEVSGERGNQA